VITSAETPPVTVNGDRASRPRIYLSPPHMSGEELRYVREAFETNWVAPLGPHVEAFERELCEAVGAAHAVAVASGTAALHLALILAGVGPGDDVFVSTFTFAASANPIVYLGARPVFIDSERLSWNMDPGLLEEALAARARAGRLPRAVVVAHIYGQSADLDPIAAACARYGVPLIEDAAEALGATYKGRAPGTVGLSGGSPRLGVIHRGMHGFRPWVGLSPWSSSRARDATAAEPTNARTSRKRRHRRRSDGCLPIGDSRRMALDRPNPIANV
jgi:hypothetical protein